MRVEDCGGTRRGSSLRRAEIGTFELLFAVDAGDESSTMGTAPLYTPSMYQFAYQLSLDMTVMSWSTRPGSPC
jgi:hypothetical protein